MHTAWSTSAEVIADAVDHRSAAGLRGRGEAVAYDFEDPVLAGMRGVDRQRAHHPARRGDPFRPKERFAAQIGLASAR